MNKILRINFNKAANMRKCLTTFSWIFECGAVQKFVNLVDFVKSFLTTVYLQKSASIQPRTSRSKHLEVAHLIFSTPSVGLPHLPPEHAGGGGEEELRHDGRNPLPRHAVADSAGADAASYGWLRSATGRPAGSVLDLWTLRLLSSWILPNIPILAARVESISW